MRRRAADGWCRPDCDFAESVIFTSQTEHEASVYATRLAPHSPPTRRVRSKPQCFLPGAFLVLIGPSVISTVEAGTACRFRHSAHADPIKPKSISIASCANIFAGDFGADVEGRSRLKLGGLHRLDIDDRSRRNVSIRPGSPMEGVPLPFRQGPSSCSGMTDGMKRRLLKEHWQISACSGHRPYSGNNGNSKQH
jgi:hypothetical protein